MVRAGLLDRLNPLALLVAGAFFMEFLDGTIITPALPQMAVSLGTDAVSLHVGISAYLLTVAVFILPGGWAADRFGARPVFTGAIVVFTVGSGLCALATDTTGFVAARVLQGLGGAMMVPVGRLVVLRTTAKADLMGAIATLTWPGLSAPLLGPPLGGFIAQTFSWRYIFLVNLPLGALALLLALRLVPDVKGTRRPFDWRGFLLAAAACVCLTRALDLLGEGDLPVPAVALLAFGTLVAGWLFVRHLNRFDKPLLDPAPWAVPSFRLMMMNGTTMRLLIAAVPFLLPLMFQLGFGMDPFHAGLLVLVLFAGNLGIKPLTSSILRRFGFRAVLLGNALIQAATMAAFGLLVPGMPLAAMLVLLVVAGSSRSMQFTAVNTLAFAEVPDSAMGPANTWFSVTYQLSNGLGVAVGAVLLRLSAAATGGVTLGAFHWAFLALAALMAGMAATALSLASDAGAEVAGRRRA